LVATKDAAKHARIVFSSNTLGRNIYFQTALGPVIH
jgi:hypothetical protein